MLERAEAAYSEAGDTLTAAKVAARLADVYWHQGHLQQAIERLEPAVRTLEAGEHGAHLAVVDAAFARFLGLDGQSDRAMPHLERALSLAEALDLPETLVSALTTRAMLLTSVDRNYESRVLLEGALVLALAHDLHDEAQRTSNNLVDALERVDSFRDVATTSERRLELARRFGSRFSEAGALGSQVAALVLLGRWDEALARAVEVEERVKSGWTRSLLSAIVMRAVRTG